MSPRLASASPRGQGNVADLSALRSPTFLRVSLGRFPERQTCLRLAAAFQGLDAANHGYPSVVLSSDHVAELPLRSPT